MRRRNVRAHENALEGLKGVHTSALARFDDRVDRRADPPRRSSNRREATGSVRRLEPDRPRPGRPLAPREEFARVATAPLPEVMPLSADGRETVLGHRKGGLRSIVDANIRKIRAAIDAGSDPFRSALAPDSATAFWPEPERNRTTICDVATPQITARIPVSGCPTGLELAPDGT